MATITLDNIYTEITEKGLYFKTSYIHPKKTQNKSVRLTLGRIWFNLLTPDDYPLVTSQVNSKKLKEIIKDVHNKYPVEITAKFVDDVNRESFVLGTIKPSTFDIDSLVVPDFILEKKAELLTDPDITPQEFKKVQLQLAEEYLKYIKENYDSGVYDILMSGAKGSAMDWAYLMVARGPTTDLEGKMKPPILESLDDGLDIDAFYDTAAEARGGYFLRSKGSAEPGYLSSKVSYASSNLMLSETDCKTKRTYKLKVTDSIFIRILGRTYIEGAKKITIDESMKKDLVGKTISLRSPLYCISKEGICSVCYGKLSDKIGTTKIGLIAASTINDLGVNMAMKGRHSTGNVASKPANFKKDLIT